MSLLLSINPIVVHLGIHEKHSHSWKNSRAVCAFLSLRKRGWVMIGEGSGKCQVLVVEHHFLLHLGSKRLEETEAKLQAADPGKATAFNGFPKS